ncbi:MAG: hypothetical protein AAGK04_03890 [Planctomycetota bacterium]
MMSSPELRRVIAFGVLLSSLCTTWPAIAQEADKADRYLDAKRASYERAVESIRQHVESILDKKRESAFLDAGEGERVNAVLEELAAYKSRGEIPDVEHADRIRGQYARAAHAMMEAFDKVALSVGDPDIIRDEKASFESHWDLAPWSQLHSSDVTTRQGTALTLESVTPGDYRLEVEFQCTEAVNSIDIELPLGVDTRARLSALPDRNGRARIFLTVREGRVIPNVGLTRPIDSVIVDSGRGLVLEPVGGDATIELVRHKRLIEGRPPKLEAQAKARPDRPGAPKPKAKSDPWRQGKTWSGREHFKDNPNRDQGANIKLTKREGDRVVLTLRRTRGAVMKITGHVRGDRLAVTRVEQTRGPGGAAPPRCDNGTGSGVIQPDGRFTLRYSYNWSTRSKKNQLWEGTFNTE